MSWLKEVIVDIAVTIFIIAAALLGDIWMKWVIWIYTALMLLAKSVVLMGDSYVQLLNKAKTNAPEWFSHLLYGLNTLALWYIHWWYAAAAWAVIWLLSFFTQRKLNAAQSN